MDDAAPEEWFPAHTREGFALFWRACEGQLEPTLHKLRVLLGERAPLAGRGVLSTPDETQARGELFMRGLRLGVAGDFTVLEQLYAELGTRWSRAGVALKHWYEVAELVRQSMLPALLSAYGSDGSRLLTAISGLTRFVDNATRIVTQQYIRERESLLAEQRRQTEDALVRYQRLAESGIIGIVVCDIYGQAKEANQGFLDMVGYTREELLALNWLEMTPPELLHLDEDALKQLKATGRTRPWEKEYLRKDGSRVPVLIGVAMLNETDCVAFVLDITERKRLEEVRLRGQQLESQNLRIREANRLKSEFLANMSHELRTPLNSILGFADLLYDGDVEPGSPNHREFLGDILKSGRHLLQLVNDVLDLAKVESGKMDFRSEPILLTALVNEVCAVVRTLAAERGIRIEISIDPRVNELTLDPSRLKQVLYNYVSNAIKFSCPEGVIQIRAVPEQLGDFRLEVADTGVGIAAEDLGRLFVEFQQVGQGGSNRPAGTGLGLALTKRIVEAQGGWVSAQSKLGKGSVFSAVLPRNMPTTSAPVERLTLEASEAKVAVLVVDDDEQDSNTIARILDGAGYGVETAASGEQAIARCGARLFDAITLDLLLPDMSGLDVLRRIRGEGLNRETPVIVVSVVAERGVVGSVAVHDYFRKPVRCSELLESLSQAGILPETSGTILLVDDDQPSLKLMDVTLSNLGYTVVCSDNGEVGLAAAQLNPPLAVILDLSMPGVDGFEFLVRFRSDPRLRTVPVIVWTVKDLTPLDRRRLSELAQGVFAKGSGRPAALLEELQAQLAPGRRFRVGE